MKEPTRVAYGYPNLAAWHQKFTESRETNREPLEECKDADASNVLGRSPPNPGDPRRDHSEEGVAGPSPSPMEHESSVAAVQAAGQPFPHSRALLESPVEALARGVDEQTGPRALASQSVGRRESDKKEPQLRRPSERPPQRVSKTLVPEFSRADEPVETIDSVQGAPATDWQHRASKTTTVAKPLSGSRNQNNKAAHGRRTPPLSGQLEQRPAQPAFEPSAKPSTETRGEKDVNTSRWRHSAATPPLPSWGREFVDQGQGAADEEIAENGKISLPTAKAAGALTPRGSQRDSRKGVFKPEIGTGGPSKTPTSRSKSSKLRPSPAPSRQSESPEHSTLSEKSLEGSRTPNTSAGSARQLKQHVFDPPWMKQRPRRESKLLPLSFGSRRNTILTTSTWARGSPLRVGERRNGFQRAEAFGNLQSPSQFLSTTTQRFFTDKGVKAFLRNQPTAAVLCALLLLAAGSALLLLLGVFGGGVGDRRRGSAAMCRTEPCREYSRRLAASVNSSLSPCDGFTRFVCDGWRRHNRLSVRQMAFLSELPRMSHLLRSMPVPRKAQKPLQRAAAFYRSCDALRRGDADELPKVKAALLRAGVTWPRLPKDSDPVDLLRTLLHVSLRLRWSAVLHVSIRRGPNATIVTLAPLREVERIVEKHRKLANSVRAAQAYFETLRQAFGGTAEETVNFANHVKLHNAYMVPLSAALNLPTSSGAFESLDVLSTVPGLSKERWMTELGPYGGGSGPVVFESNKPGYVTTFLKLWEASGERDMHAFFSWCTVQTAALYANRRLLVNFYGCEDCADLHHGAFCLSKAYLLGGNRLFGDYFDELLSERAVKSARRVVVNTFQAFAQRIDKWPHRDLKYTMVRDWDTATDVVLGYFDPHSGLRAHKQATAAVLNPGDMDDSLVENWPSIALRLQADAHDRWVASEQMEFEQWTVLLPADVVAVLPYALSFPSFDESATLFVNQGGLGNHVASALSEIFLQRYADSPGTAASALQCAGNASRFDEGQSPGRLLRSLMRTLALEVSLEAYHAAGVGHNGESIEGFGGYGATAMFFVASCYVLCGGHDGVRHSTGDECDESFRNVNGFANAFACEPGSLMSPVDNYEPANVQGVAGSGRTCVNVWGAVSSHGVGPLHLIDGAFTPKPYCSEILDNVLLPYAHAAFSDANFVSKHDLAPVRTGKIVEEHLETRRVHLLSWLAKGTVMNICETVWGRMEASMVRQRIYSVTVDELVPHTLCAGDLATWCLGARPPDLVSSRSISLVLRCSPCASGGHLF
ncbi:uncharacterized protein LOC142559256 [Dermacentor variabilis]|uniref:uncharacterized protein LOC142559256 n=1 Tax=Dermacentor variabilis TaxID=34621 RepID=UPI003F5CBC57